MKGTSQRNKPTAARPSGRVLLTYKGRNMLQDNVIERQAERLTLAELETEMESFQNASQIHMLTENWNRRNEIIHKWKIYWRVYKRKGGTRE